MDDLIKQLAENADRKYQAWAALLMQNIPNDSVQRVQQMIEYKNAEREKILADKALQKAIEDWDNHGT